jgi:hypothetical protein
MPKVMCPVGVKVFAEVPQWCLHPVVNSSVRSIHYNATLSTTSARRQICYKTFLCYHSIMYKDIVIYESSGARGMLAFVTLSYSDTFSSPNNCVNSCCTNPA